jgi:hypothetical protein
MTIAHLSCLWAFELHINYNIYLRKVSIGTRLPPRSILHALSSTATDTVGAEELVAVASGPTGAFLPAESMSRAVDSRRRFQAWSFSERRLNRYWAVPKSS